MKRPFRIWDEKERFPIPHRCYGTEETAVERCLTLIYWLELGNSYTVYDQRNGRVVVQFTRKINHIQVDK